MEMGCREIATGESPTVGRQLGCPRWQKSPVGRIRQRSALGSARAERSSVLVGAGERAMFAGWRGPDNFQVLAWALVGIAGAAALELWEMVTLASAFVVLRLLWLVLEPAARAVWAHGAAQPTATATKHRNHPAFLCTAAGDSKEIRPGRCAKISAFSRPSLPWFAPIACAADELRACR